MSHPLDGATRRLSRAGEHFELVQREWDSIPRGAKSVTLRSEYEIESQKIVIKVDTVPDFPPHWEMEISEGFFNLRAALDYVAWELAKWNLHGEREPYRQTQYPIATKEAAFKSLQVQNLRDEHIAIIQALQPYAPRHLAQPRYREMIGRGVDPEALAKQHVAWIIQDTNNTDKHRILEVTSGGATTARIGGFTAIGCDVTNHKFFIPDPRGFKKDAKWAEFDVVAVTEDDPRVDVPVDIDPVLLFGGNRIVPGHTIATEYVSGVIRTFSRTDVCDWDAGPPKASVTTSQRPARPVQPRRRRKRAHR